MRLYQNLFSLLVLIVFLTGCQTAQKKVIGGVTSTSGNQTEIWKYTPTKNQKQTTIVYMHGKAASPNSPHNASFINKMYALGYEVIAPIMPWSPLQNYEGSLQDGYDAIDTAIEKASYSKVIVAGHSMGGIAVFQYGSGKVNPKVKGLIPIAPGHDPNISKGLRSHTEKDADKACIAMESGDAKKRSSYKEMKSGKTYYINASAEYYCTHYNKKYYPNSLEIAKDIKTPIFLLSGKGDKLTRHYRHHDIFTSFPSLASNRHEVLSGGHGDVLYRHTDILSEWIDSL
ncbi:MAG: alpha/beta hydrolase [Sedimenticola sp.]